MAVLARVGLGGHGCDFSCSFILHDYGQSGQGGQGNFSYFIKKK
jgi:hypothetical protein